MAICKEKHRDEVLKVVYAAALLQKEGTPATVKNISDDLPDFRPGLVAARIAMARRVGYLTTTQQGAGYKLLPKGKQLLKEKLADVVAHILE